MKKKRNIDEILLYHRDIVSVCMCLLVLLLAFVCRRIHIRRNFRINVTYSLALILVFRWTSEKWKAIINKKKTKNVGRAAKNVLCCCCNLQLCSIKISMALTNSVEWYKSQVFSITYFIRSIFSDEKCPHSYWNRFFYYYILCFIQENCKIREKWNLNIF